MKSNKKSVFLKKNLKHIFSLEDKRKFYFEWENSGLSKSKFCKKKGLLLSSFSRWCKEFSFDKSNRSSQEDEISSILKNIPCEKSILVEIKLPNGMMFSSSFELPYFILFLKSLSCALQSK